MSNEDNRQDVENGQVSEEQTSSSERSLEVNQSEGRQQQPVDTSSNNDEHTDQTVRSSETVHNVSTLENRDHNTENVNDETSTTNRRSTTERHMRSHTNEKLFTCDACDESFTQWQDLKTHKMSHHQAGPSSQSNSTAHTTGNGQEKPSYPCWICDRIFFRKYYLRDHIRQIHERPFTCKRCIISFTSSSDLDTHKKGVHQRVWKYFCRKCNRSYASNRYFKRHLRDQHGGKKPYTCEVCKKSFNQLRNLQAHKKTQHQGIPYECDRCGSTFICKKKLQYHLHKHSCKDSSTCYPCHLFNYSIPAGRRKPIRQGKRVYHCMACGRKFNYLSNLRRHLKTHRKEKQSKARKKSIHRISNSYECYVCRKCIKQKSKLIEHFRIHSGEKPFACNFCKMKFSQSNILKTHTLRKHKYSCDLCNSSFKNTSNLVLHKNIVHQET